MMLSMEEGPLHIGEVAAGAGVNIQTLRYYERRGLLPAPRRSRSGYRQYSDDAVRMVTFIKRAQELGFTLREVKELLKLRAPGPKRREAARATAAAKVRDIDDKMRDLAAIRSALASLIEACASSADSTASCPILEALEKPTTTP
jgi:Hg(II)-responsive transcriptional regulator